MVVPEFWDDERLSGTSPIARLVALFLITSRQSLILPGLLNMGAAGLAEAARLPYEDTKSAMVELAAVGFIEVDERARLIRVPKAPKYHSPNANCLRAWFRRWQALPASPLKAAHVASLRDGLPPSVRGSVWDQTFGTIKENTITCYPSGRGNTETVQPTVLGVQCSLVDLDPIPDAREPLAHGSSSPLAQLDLVPPDPPPVSDSDLLAVYAKYPRKEGKAPGLDTLRKEIRTPAKLLLLQQAINAYVAKWHADGTELKFTPHFSTWANHWQRWLDPDEVTPVQSAEARAPPRRRGGGLEASEMREMAAELRRRREEDMQ